ncbi:hypothetical protein Tco_1409368 [Tanacetum coccineum]
MESIRRKFFNGIHGDEKKVTWVKCSKVLAAKKHGGLGVSSYYALNRALLFKWAWRFISQDNSLWFRFISSMHECSRTKENSMATMIEDYFVHNVQKSLLSFQTVAQTHTAAQTQIAAQTQATAQTYKVLMNHLLLTLALLRRLYEYNKAYWFSKSRGKNTKVKPSFSYISKAKASILAKASGSSSSKAKVQPSRSKAKASGSKAKAYGSKAKAFGSKTKASPKTLIVKSPIPITNYVLGLANAKTCDAILNKAFRVKYEIKHKIL